MVANRGLHAASYARGPLSARGANGFHRASRQGALTPRDHAEPARSNPPTPLVQASSAQSSMAGSLGRSARPLPGLAQRDHAPANSGRSRRGAVPSVSGTLARRHRTRACRRERGSRCVGRARLLPESPQSTSSRPNRRGRVGRTVPVHRTGAQDASRSWRLHGSRHRRLCLRRPHGCRRWQRRAGAGKGICRRRPSHRGSATPQRARLRPRADLVSG